VPFAWHGQTCSLQLGTALFAVAGMTMTTVSGMALSSCQPHVNAMCLLPRLFLGGGRSQAESCLRNLFTSKNGEDFLTHCVFPCTPHSRVRIMQLDLERYSLTHATGVLKFVSSFQNDSEIIVPENHHIGAL
jgi:hypothetical protein